MIKVYEVGGHVRDRFLGIKSKDIDYAVEAPSYEAMREWVAENTQKIFLETPQYFTIRALTKDNKAVDFVLCRKESGYSDQRHPDKVEPGTIYDDLARRDFTINAIAIDSDGNVIDPHNGLRDIKLRHLTCVGEAHERFAEDPLRILRAIRFAITKGFHTSYSIDYILRIDYKKWISQLESISQDRIRDEIYKCFAYSTPETLKLLKQYPHIWTETIFNNGLWLEPTNKQV